MKFSVVVFYLLTSLISLNTLASSSNKIWTEINVGTTKQITQIEAGFPNGCSITTVLYALKFGPNPWRSAYDKISGDSDVQKINSLAATFHLISSIKNNNKPIFDKNYGADPHDVPLMIQSLVPSKTGLSSKDYFLSTFAESSERDNFTRKFHSDLHQNLSSGQPIPLALYFSNPSASHEVLIIGVRNLVDLDGIVQILVLDPMTGVASTAIIKLETSPLFGGMAQGFSFYNTNVADRKGYILSISL